MRLKIITFNIWDLPFWFTRKDPKRIEKIGAYLADHGADIICLQESFDVGHRRLLHRSLGEKENHLSGDSTNTRNVLYIKKFDVSGGLAVFSKYPIIKSRFVPFSRRYNISAIEFFGLKGFLETVVRTPKGPLRIVNIHLRQGILPLDRWVRLRQIKEATSAFLDKDMPTVIAGDFNEDNMMFKKAFISLFKNWDFIDPSSLLTERPLDTYRPDNHYAANGFGRAKLAQRLDYMLLKGFGTLGFDVKEYRSIHLAQPLSDHDPTVLILSTERAVSENAKKA